jgi:hypothetical protein
MAMKKAEMEAENLHYREKMGLAQAAELRGMYRQVLDAAISAWPYVDGMLLHERKYRDNEVADIAAINLVLRYAPLLLDARPLNELEDLLAGYKRVLKESFATLTANLSRARTQVAENHRLWTYLEKNPGAEQDRLCEALGGEQERWRSVAESWERMGLLTRVPADRGCRLTLLTRMGEVVPGKCPACGHRGRAPKAMFLGQVTCPECGAHVTFVLLAARPVSQG